MLIDSHTACDLTVNVYLYQLHTSNCVKDVVVKSSGSLASAALKRSSLEA